MRLFLFLIPLMCTPTLLWGQDWFTNIDKALEHSKKSETPVLMIFHGSDWCGECQQLDQRVWSSESFRRYAEDHFTLLLVDFPQKKKNALPKPVAQHNEALGQKYNPEVTFPFVVMLNSEGDVLATTGYKDYGPIDFISYLEYLQFRSDR
jgi:thioredoxin-related protein